MDDSALLAHWKPAYKRGFAMQASLAVVGFIVALVAWWQTRHWLWMLGGVVLLANWPYTLLAMMPINRKLVTIDLGRAGAESRLLVERWGRLHAAGTGLGFTATAIFLSASVS